jgi:hypothetical protein
VQEDKGELLPSTLSPFLRQLSRSSQTARRESEILSPEVSALAFVGSAALPTLATLPAAAPEAPAATEARATTPEVPAPAPAAGARSALGGMAATCADPGGGSTSSTRLSLLASAAACPWILVTSLRASRQVTTCVRLAARLRMAAGVAAQIRSSVLCFRSV